MNTITPSYQRKLEDICNGYSFKEMSAARKLVILKYLNYLDKINLDGGDINNLSEDILDSATRNKELAFNEIQKHTKILYGIELPHFTDENYFIKLNTEKEYTDFLSDRILSNTFIFNQLDKETKKNIVDYDNGVNIKLPEHLNEEIEMYVIKGSKIELPFDLYFRVKNTNSLLYKMNERDARIRCPSKNDVENFKHFLNSNKRAKEELEDRFKFKPNDDLGVLNYFYTATGISLVKNILTSGDDTQKYLENIEKNSLDDYFSLDVGKLFAVDNLGARFVLNDKAFSKLNKYLENNKNLISNKYYNYYETKEKDLSVVAPIRIESHGGIYLELRLQLPKSVAEGDFGKTDVFEHRVYKNNSSIKFEKKLENYPYFLDDVKLFLSYFNKSFNDILYHKKFKGEEQKIII